MAADMYLAEKLYRTDKKCIQIYIICLFSILNQNRIRFIYKQMNASQEH